MSEEKYKLSRLITYLYETMNGELARDYAELDSENIELLLKELEEKDKEIERLNKSLEEQRHFYLEKLQQKENIIKEVRDNLENSIKSINEKLKNNKEPFEVIDGRIQYINDYRVVRLKAFRTKCKELLEILDKEVK